MEFVYCPNGHANRPGTRICAVCRALIEQRAPRPAVAPPSPPPPAPQPARRPSTATTAPIADTTPEAAPPRKRSRWWLWLLLLLLGLLVALALAVWAFLLPISRSDEARPSPVVESTAAVVVANTPELVPTDPPQPTATVEVLPPPTESADEAAPTAVSTITPLSTIVGVVITPTFSLSPDTNLLQNGDFASDWANGWSSEMNGEANVVEIRPVEGEPGVNALHLEQDGPGYLQLAQRVVLIYPVEGLEFQARLRPVGTTLGAAEGRSVLILQYEDFNGDPIGASVWLDGSAESTGLWDSPLLASLSGVPVAEHALDEGWQTLTVDLGREFADELDGLSPLDVVQLTVIMAVFNSDACELESCEATLDVAELSLVPNLP